MSDDLPSATSGTSRGSRFTLASWIVLPGGLLLTFGLFYWAVACRLPGDRLAGVVEATIGASVSAIGGFICGLIALLRRERRRVFALLPFLVGLATILYIAWNLFSER